MKQKDKAAVLGRIIGMKQAADEKRNAAQKEIDTAREIIARLQKDRMAALEGQNVDAIMDIDTRIRRQQAVIEVAQHYLQTVHTEAAETVKDCLEQLGELTADAEEQARDEFVRAREQARTAWRELMAMRAQLGDAYAYLQKIAPPELQNDCTRPLSSIGQPLMKIADVYHAPTDGPATVSWRQGVQVV